MSRKIWTMYCGRDDVKVSNALLKMTKAELIDEILGTYGKEDLLEIGFLVEQEQRDETPSPRRPTHGWRGEQ